MYISVLLYPGGSAVVLLVAFVLFMTNADSVTTTSFPVSGNSSIPKLSVAQSIKLIDDFDVVVVIKDSAVVVGFVVGGDDGAVGAPGGTQVWDEFTCTTGTVVGDDGGVDNRGVFRRNGCTDLSGQRRPSSSQL